MIHQLGAFELPEESMDVRIVLTGKSPLVMHSARLADPLYEITRAIKQITDKRTKTEADYESMSYGRNLWMSLSHESAAYLPP
jgi:hypothetical protein